MKQFTAIFLVVAMLLSLTACGGSAPAETTPVETTAPETSPVEIVPEETAPPESEELQAILAEGWVPEKIATQLDTQIRWTEMLDMLGNVIRLFDESALTEWNSRYTPISANMERDDGMLAIYEAACVLGIGHRGRSGWQEIDRYYGFHPEYAEGYNPNSGIFNNDYHSMYEIAPFEANPGWEPGWDYLTCARLFSLGRSSVADPEPFLTMRILIPGITIL